MDDLNRAEQYLLDEVRRGSEAGWTRLVERYQGRLLHFARGKLKDVTEAEDLVQETFLSFLKSAAAFRGECSLETFLFTVLRRRIIDIYRGQHLHACLLQDIFPADAENSPAGAWDHWASPEPTASWYARRKEHCALDRQALADALRALIADMKNNLNFRELKIVEMVFYCQLRNKDIATIVGLDEKQVALIKHRVLRNIQDRLARTAAGRHDFDPPGDLLSDLWQSLRLSCLKRSTLGSYLLGTLDEGWRDYIAFHLDRLGCRFCRANLDDIRRQITDEKNTALQNRILHSTLGFLVKP